MKAHSLKIWPAHFDAIENGLKTWELRRNDRGFQVGDLLRLRRWDPDGEKYTGPVLFRMVTFLQTADDLPGGLHQGYVLMSIVPIK